jgi:hypothetical protein
MQSATGWTLAAHLPVPAQQIKHARGDGRGGRCAGPV